MFHLLITREEAAELVEGLKFSVEGHEDDHETFTEFQKASAVSDFFDKTQISDPEVEELKVAVNASLGLGCEPVGGKHQFGLTQPIGLNPDELMCQVVPHNGQRFHVIISRNGQIVRSDRNEERDAQALAELGRAAQARADFERAAQARVEQAREHNGEAEQVTISRDRQVKRKRYGEEKEPLRAEDMDVEAVEYQMMHGNLRGIKLYCDSCNKELPPSMMNVAYTYEDSQTGDDLHVCLDCQLDGAYDEPPQKKIRDFKLNNVNGEPIACSSTVVVLGKEAVARSQSGVIDFDWHNAVSELMRECRELNSGRLF